MKRFLHKRKGKGGDIVKTYFERQAIPCDQCGKAVAVEGVEPLTFTPCPHCGFSCFVPQHIKDYLLLEPLGAGGLSSVYRARHREHPDELFAVKLLRKEHYGDQEVVEAFLLECEMHSRIPPHDHVVDFIEGGLEDEAYYYAMEFVEGERLLRVVERDGRLGEPATLWILSQVLSGLTHIRDHGVLYRDLNAGNLLRRPDGTICLVDFGFSLPLDVAKQASTTDHLWGTPEFVPPERIYQQGEDEVSVIYSLGLLAFYLLTADTLIKSASKAGHLERHISATRLAVIPERFGDCSEGMIDLIITMAQPDRANRYPSFEEAAQAVDALRAPVAPSD